MTALIETRFAAAPTCGHCKSEIISSWGRDGSKATRLKRYMCKSCGRTFNALTGTPLAQLHRRDAWLNYARALVDRVSLRKAAVRADVCLETSFRWRHRFLQAAKDKHGAKLAHGFLTSSGAMANENALKAIFQKQHPAHRLLAFEHCFAGRTLALSQVTDKAAFTRPATHRRRSRGAPRSA